MRILATSPLIPRPDTASGDRRFFAILRLLAQRATIDFCPGEPCPDATAPDARYLHALREVGVCVVPGGTEGFHSRVSSQLYDALFAEFWRHAEFTGRLVRRIQPWTRIVVDTVDVHFLREEAAAGLGLHDPADVADRKARELAVYRSADTVVAVTEEDEAALLAAGGLPFLARLPNIVEARPRPPGKRGPELLFAGGFAHPPNRDAVHWFVAEILPAIRQQFPEIVFRVVGNRPPPDVVALGQQPGVEITGFVPEVGPYLDQAAVSVAPLRYGAGMKGKVTEALSAGLPVVTTTVGAQGLGATSGRQLIITDAAPDFAQAVIRCLRDPEGAERMGRCGQEHILKLCGEPAAAAVLDTLLATLPPRSIPRHASLRLGAYRAARHVARLAGRRH